MLYARTRRHAHCHASSRCLTLGGVRLGLTISGYEVRDTARGYKRKGAMYKVRGPRFEVSALLALLLRCIQIPGEVSYLTACILHAWDTLYR